MILLVFMQVLLFISYIKKSMRIYYGMLFLIIHQQSTTVFNLLIYRNMNLYDLIFILIAVNLDSSVCTLLSVGPLLMCWSVKCDPKNFMKLCLQAILCIREEEK